MLERGTRIVVRAYRGALLERRVWEDAGRGVLVCSEEGFRRAVETGEEPLWAGFPKDDVVEVHPSPEADDSWSHDEETQR